MSVPCNRCNRPLPKWSIASHDFALCPECGAYNMVRVFPALFVSTDGPVQTQAAFEGEATCFDHPSKRAAASCQQCGRFVCQLCSVEIKGQIWCPSCVASGNRSAKVTDLENARTLYDSMALTVAVAPLILWPVTVISAPIALFLTVRYWKRPLSLLRRGRWRYMLAILIALGEIAGWTWVMTYFVVRLRMGT